MSKITNIKFVKVYGNTKTLFTFYMLTADSVAFCFFKYRLMHFIIGRAYSTRMYRFKYIGLLNRQQLMIIITSALET